MLEYYYSSPFRLCQIRRGPLAPYLDGLAAELHENSYVRAVAQQILCIAGQFSQFLSLREIRDASNTSEELAQEFLCSQLCKVKTFRTARNAMNHVLRHFRQTNVIPQLEIPAVVNSYDDIIERYLAYLRDVRGLSASTCDTYELFAQRFLDFHIQRHSKLNLQVLDGAEVLDYLQTWVNHLPTRSWSRNLATQTRSMLRFLRWDGLLKQPLDYVVPSIPHWRLSIVPKHLPWEQVQMLIGSIDTTYPEEMRNKAIILTIATLGLRNKEVRTLEINQIDWRESKIHLPKTKNKRAKTLPLPNEVGEAIADYIMHARPHVNSPFVFLRHCAPIGPILTSSSISGMIRKRCEKLGFVFTQRIGAHLLRHSLATKMVNSGVPIKEISDMLGHISIDTTAIYTKVDIEHLKEVASPLPGGAK